MTARAAVLTLAVLAVVYVLLAAALVLGVHAGLFAAGGRHPQAARILPAPAPNAVPFTGPLPTYRPAAGHG